MGMFDFISDEDLRTSLETDFAEATACTESRAWKAVHVLVGSIIEAILIDYLLASGHKKRAGVDPLNMTLAQLIDASEREGILSRKTKELSSAIKSYRNLIHPGRAIRLQETADKSSAQVVRALLEIVCAEIAARRKERYGYTAEQIASKVERDASSLAILHHLSKESSESEKRRLLLKVIPQRYFELDEPVDVFDPGFDAQTAEIQARLSKAFRAIFELASRETKKEVTANFLAILKEEEEHKVFTYETEFFRAADLQYLPQKHATVIKEHLLSRLGQNVTSSLLEAMSGIEKDLKVSDVNRLVDPLVRTITRGKDAKVKGAATTLLISIHSELHADLSTKLLDRLTMWINHFDSRDQNDFAQEVREIKETCELPF